MAKKTFVAYTDWNDYIVEMDDPAVADLMRAIFAKACEEQYEIKDITAKVVFKRISTQMDEDARKYAEKCEKNKEIALQREANKRARKNTDEHERARTTSDNENENDNDNENDSHYMRESNSPPSLTEVYMFFKSEGLNGKASDFHSYYSARGWKGITNWQEAAWLWSSREGKFG